MAERIAENMEGYATGRPDYHAYRKRKVAYVAGPFRGRTHYQIRLNIRAAEAIALELWKMGYAAVCPHLNTANFQDELPDENWLEGDLSILGACDLVVMVPGWQASAGSRDEANYAREHGIPVFYWTLDQDRLRWYASTGCDASVTYSQELKRQMRQDSGETT